MRPITFSGFLLTGLVLGASPVLAATVTRGPFLQQTTPTSTLVVARTDTAASLEVRDPEGKVLARDQGTKEHQLRLTGLPPASNVTYQLFLDGKAVGQAATFHTPGLPGTEGARHAVLGVVGDMGSGEDNERANVQQLKARGVEAVLTVGDNAYDKGAPEEWDPKLFQPFAPLLSQATLWPALGDHEYLTPGATGYLDAFVLPEGPEGERYYSFDWGDLHVAVLDTNCVDPLDEVVCTPGKMAQWLAADLAASKAPWKIVTFHRPAVSSGHYPSNARVAQALIPIIEKGGVDLVFQGHNHSYERTWPIRGGKAVQKGYVRSAAPVYVTTGGGGDWLYEADSPLPDWSAVRRVEYHHLQLTLDGGSLRVDAIRPDGSRFDTFTLTKDVPAPSPQPTPTPGDGGTGTPGDAGQTPGASTPPPTEPSVTPGTPGEPTSPDAPPLTGCSSVPGASLGLPLLGLLLGGYLRRRRQR